MPVNSYFSSCSRNRVHPWPKVNAISMPGACIRHCCMTVSRQQLINQLHTTVQLTGGLTLQIWHRLSSSISIAVLFYVYTPRHRTEQTHTMTPFCETIRHAVTVHWNATRHIRVTILPQIFCAPSQLFWHESLLKHDIAYFTAFCLFCSVSCGCFSKGAVTMVNKLAKTVCRNVSSTASSQRSSSNCLDTHSRRTLKQLL